jgi:hypothetical protein
MTAANQDQVPWAHPLLLVAATLAAYLNALSAGFQFDDFNVIVLNDAVHSWSAWWQSMPGIRPLLKLSYTGNWVAAPEAQGFHLVNIVVHLGNVLLAYALLRRWTQLTAPTWARPEPVALYGALIFALHPANTEAVTYVSGRSVSLMALFYLASLVVVLRSEARTDAPGPLLAGALLFMLALATKEIALTLPVALMLILWLGARPVPRAARAIWLVALLGVLAALSVERYRLLLGTSLGTRSIADNLLTQAEGIHYLISQPLLSARLNIDPDIPERLALTWNLAWKLALPATLIGMALVQLRRRPWLSLAILWFFLHLAPTNSILARLDVANDRQLYLAMLGPAFLLGLALQRLTAKWRWPVVLALAVALGGTTWARNRDYRDEASLWLATTARSPGKARPWNNLGYAYYLAGQRSAARSAYLRALSIDPGYDKAAANLKQLEAGQPDMTYP